MKVSVKWQIDEGINENDAMEHDGKGYKDIDQWTRSVYACFSLAHRSHCYLSTETTSTTNDSYNHPQNTHIHMTTEQARRKERGANTCNCLCFVS